MVVVLVLMIQYKVLRIRKIKSAAFLVPTKVPNFSTQVWQFV